MDRECGACGRVIHDNGSLYCGLDHEPLDNIYFDKTVDQQMRYLAYKLGRFFQRLSQKLLHWSFR